MQLQDVVISSAVRTPIGRFMGVFQGMPATHLGSVAITQALARAEVAAADVDEVILGNVLSANLGQAPARQAAIGAGLPVAVPALTVNKVCGSGLKAVMLATDALWLGHSKVVVAGGMEAMSNAPFMLSHTRAGRRFGHDTVIDHMLRDGLEDAYEVGRAMGTFGEDLAERYGFTREVQDAYAMATLRRAQTAAACGEFAAEIARVPPSGGGGAVAVDADEIPTRLVADKIPTLRPAFRPDGTITAASSSANGDAAAALVLTTLRHAGQAGMPVLARVKAHATAARTPAEFTLAPVDAVRRVLHQVGWAPEEVDLYEINEAFAVVVLAAIRDLGLDPERVNVRGGACALGHPIGASGARVLVTLVHAMKARGARRGVATLCIGGGEAVAMAVEAF